MSNPLSIAVSGLVAAAQKTLSAARNIANTSTPDYQKVEANVTSEQAGPNDGAGVLSGLRPSASNLPVDIASEAVSLLQASTAYKANAAVIRAVDKNDDALLKALDTKA